VRSAPVGSHRPPVQSVMAASPAARPAFVSGCGRHTRRTAARPAPGRPAARRTAPAVVGRCRRTARRRPAPGRRRCRAARVVLLVRQSASAWAFSSRPKASTWPSRPVVAAGLAEVDAVLRDGRGGRERILAELRFVLGLVAPRLLLLLDLLDVRLRGVLRPGLVAGQPVANDRGDVVRAGRPESVLPQQLGRGIQRHAVAFLAEQRADADAGVEVRRVDLAAQVGAVKAAGLGEDRDRVVLLDVDRRRARSARGGHTRQRWGRRGGLRDGGGNVVASRGSRPSSTPARPSWPGPGVRAARKARWAAASRPPRRCPSARPASTRRRRAPAAR